MAEELPGTAGSPSASMEKHDGRFLPTSGCGAENVNKKRGSLNSEKSSALRRISFRALPRFDLAGRFLFSGRVGHKVDWKAPLFLLFERVDTGSDKSIIDDSLSTVSDNNGVGALLHVDFFG